MTSQSASNYGVEESASIIERIQGFVAENKRAVLIGTAAALLAVGGVAAYQYHVASSSASAGGSRRRTKRGVDVEKGEGAAGEAGGDGKKRKSKKKKTVKDEDGPILEEVKPASISGESVLCAVVLPGVWC
jgi:import receptor subunit TOM70